MNNQFIITWYQSLAEYEVMLKLIAKRYPRYIISEEQTSQGFTHYHALVSTGDLVYKTIKGERQFLSRGLRPRKTDKYNLNITGVDDFYSALRYVRKDGKIKIDNRPETETYREFIAECPQGIRKGGPKLIAP